MGSNVLSELIVVKRSGQRVPFNGTKIALAIKKAFDSVSPCNSENVVNKIYNSVLDHITKNYIDRKTITVEAIQDIIEGILKEEKHYDVYKHFSAYRLKRKASREAFDEKQQHKFVKSSEKLIFALEDDESNPLESLFKLGKTISNEFAKSYLIDSKYVRGHDEGSIFIHDLDYYVLGATFSTHLDLSFIDDFEYYFEKVLKHLLCIKDEQCGEHSITSIDYLFVPWLIYEFRKIFKSNLLKYLELEGFNSYLNIKKLEELINKLETTYFDIKIFKEFIVNKRGEEVFNKAIDSSLKELEEILKAKLRNLLLSLNSYDHMINKEYGYTVSLGTNTTRMGILINKVYLELIEELDRLNNVMTIYKLKDEKSDLEEISKLVTKNKNIAFNYINASFNRHNYNSEVEYFSDGKRILENVIDKNQMSEGRSIISKVSINLVRIALESNGLNEFYTNLENMLDFAKNELLQAFDYLSGKYKKNYKYSFNELTLDSDKLDEDTKIRKVIKNGTLNIGYSGLNETLRILNNKNDLDVGDFKLASDIVKFMKFKCDKFKDLHKLNFVIFETVDSKVLDYFEKIDKVIYGIAIKNKYEPTYKMFDKVGINLEDRLKIESKMQKYSDGGYLEVINIPKNASYKKVLEVINKAIECDIGYFKIVVGKLE